MFGRVIGHSALLKPSGCSLRLLPCGFCQEPGCRARAEPLSSPLLHLVCLEHWLSFCKKLLCALALWSGVYVSCSPSSWGPITPLRLGRRLRCWALPGISMLLWALCLLGGADPGPDACVLLAECVNWRSWGSCLPAGRASGARSSLSTRPSSSRTRRT